MITANHEDTYRINLIVGFLMQFPEIFTVNYDLESSSYCFAFMIRKKISSGQYRRFCKDFMEIWDSYCYFSKRELSEFKIRKHYCYEFTRLDLFFARENLSSEEVSLVNNFVKDKFGENLISDYREGDSNLFTDYRQTDDDYLEFLLIQGEKRPNALFAFRESGKVYVLNK